MDAHGHGALLLYQSHLSEQLSLVFGVQSDASFDLSMSSSAGIENLRRIEVLNAKSTTFNLP